MQNHKPKIPRYDIPHWQFFLGKRQSSFFSTFPTTGEGHQRGAGGQSKARPSGGDMHQLLHN